MNKKQKLAKYLQQFNEEIQWRKMQRFLEVFKPKYLEKIIKYHGLNCADIKQYRRKHEKFKRIKFNLSKYLGGYY